MVSTTLNNNYTLPFPSTTYTGTNGVSLPLSTIPANSTTNFTSTGSFYIPSSLGLQVVNYTGISGNNFTGCTGGTGNIYATATSILTISSIIQVESNLSINVVSTSGFPNKGSLIINSQIINYTGISGNNFTGCTGGTGNISSTQSVILNNTGLINDLSISIIDNFFRPILSISGANYDQALVVFFKMRGFYVAGNVYETYIVTDQPSSIPPSGHPLINVEVMASWIDGKVLVT